MEVVLYSKNRQVIHRIEATTLIVGDRLLSIMKSHIGQEQGIARNALFKQVYGVSPDSLKELEEFVLFDIFKKAMHRCRQRTKCFITNKTVNNLVYYFVVKDRSDVACYSALVNRSIKAMRAMERKAFKAVREHWYKADWVEQKRLM